MGRPASKSELLTASADNYNKLIDYINNLDDEARNAEFPPEYMNRNIRDVVAHLYHWHLMFMKWYWDGMNGAKPHIPAEGYTWKTVPELNRWIREKYTDKSLDEMIKELVHSHGQVMEIIKDYPADEMFVKKKLKWTGTTSLGSYLVGATSSHYDWAFKLIKKCLKQKSVI